MATLNYHPVHGGSGDNAMPPNARSKNALRVLENLLDAEGPDADSPLLRLQRKARDIIKTSNCGPLGAVSSLKNAGYDSDDPLVWREFLGWMNGLSWSINALGAK